jgi:hypothetical protein
MRCREYRTRGASHYVHLSITESAGEPTGEVGPFAAVVTLQFRKEAPVWTEVMDVSPEFGTSWDDWGEAKERERRAAHDRWLEASGAPAGRHPWARVWSDYDSERLTRSGATPHRGGINYQRGRPPVS